MTTPQPGWYDDPEDANSQRYWDGQNWTPHRQLKNTTPTTRDPAPVAPPPPPPFRPPPAAGTTPSNGLGPYVDKVRPHVAKGQQFWSGLSRQSKIVFAVVGLVVAVALVAVPVIAFNYLIGGGSGPSAAYQDGYNSGLNQAKAPAGRYTDPSQYCGTFSIGATGGNEAARQDWINGCMAGFQKGQFGDGH